MLTRLRVLSAWKPDPLSHARLTRGRVGHLARLLWVSTPSRFTPVIVKPLWLVTYRGEILRDRRATGGECEALASVPSRRCRALITEGRWIGSLVLVARTLLDLFQYSGPIGRRTWSSSVSPYQAYLSPPASYRLHTTPCTAELTAALPSRPDSRACRLGDDRPVRQPASATARWSDPPVNRC